MKEAIEAVIAMAARQVLLGAPAALAMAAAAVVVGRVAAVVAEAVKSSGKRHSDSIVRRFGGR